MRSAEVECLVRPYGPGDAGGVAELMTAALGPGPLGARTQEFFDWKHADNPFGPSLLLVAEIEGRIAGLRAFMRWRFASAGTTVAAVRAIDTATHPEYQGRGVFSRLTRAALGRLGGVGLVFNTPNGKSGPGYLKMGWREAGAVPIWVRVRPLAAVSCVARAAAGGAAGPPIAAPPAASALEDGDGLAALLQEGADEPRLHTERTMPYLRWRYACAPGLDYRAVTARRRTRLAGAAFFRVRRRGRMWETTVADVIVRPGDVATARELLRKAAAAAPTHHVASHFASGSAQLRAARGAGYVRAPRGMTLVVNRLDPDLPVDPARLDAWAFCLGDLEVF